ncbi:MAG: hypothetical protein HOQ30_12885 [Gemmatimonadaceae bacterium]|nr:hypothetical protein [Gemmatimonadaceae bacterium]NUQ92217.1 hypothetical protein [Gemmatimonadaceae bacterium]NUR34901.1 hypothetical protein [Gemmatimonadaceae bacterium]
MRSSLRHDAPAPVLRRPRHAFVLVLALVVGCERSSTTRASDSATSAGAAGADSGEQAALNSGWSPDAGAVLLVASDIPDVAQVVFPEVTDSTFGDSTLTDLAPVRGTRVTLYSRHGETGTAIVAGEDSTERSDSTADECDGWPAVRLRGEGQGVTGTWNVGLVSGRAQAIPLDSIERLSRADSARLAGEVARLASGLPEDTARAFRGLPYFVRTVRRFHPVPGVDALVADVSRRINQEANPREEQILVVAERDSGRADSPWRPAFVERASGHEGSVETHDVLAAVAIGPARRPSLLVARYVSDGTAYLLLERTGPGQWRVRWVSAAAGCG